MQLIRSGGLEVLYRFNTFPVSSVAITSNIQCCNHIPYKENAEGIVECYVGPSDIDISSWPIITSSNIPNVAVCREIGSLKVKPGMD